MVQTVQIGGQALDPALQMPPQVLPPPVVVKPERKKRTYKWTCQYCGQPFETPYYSQRYCTKTHKKYAQRERSRE